MELAHIIKGLFTAECAFQILNCTIASPLRSAFLLWGWQPTMFIDILSHLGNLFLPMEHQSHNGSEYFVLEDGIRQNETGSMLSVRNIEQQTTFYANHTSHGNTRDNQSDYIPTIETICFIPASFAFANSYGISIFIMLTSIVR